MPGFKKVSFHIIFSLSLIFLLSYCTPDDPNQLDADTFRKYEMQLKTLHQKTDELPVDGDPAKFIALYKQSMQILNLIPDT